MLVPVFLAASAAFSTPPPLVHASSRTMSALRARCSGVGRGQSRSVLVRRRARCGWISTWHGYWDDYRCRWTVVVHFNQWGCGDCIDSELSQPSFVEVVRWCEHVLAFIGKCTEHNYIRFSDPTTLGTDWSGPTADRHNGVCISSFAQHRRGRRCAHHTWLGSARFE